MQNNTIRNCLPSVIVYGSNRGRGGAAQERPDRKLYILQLESNRDKRTQRDSEMRCPDVITMKSIAYYRYDDDIKY